MVKPDYIFETSWEVCNKVGGIYAVLSTKARSMQALCPDKVIFFGPDLHEQSNKYFIPDEKVLTGWRAFIKTIPHPLCSVRVGRWNVPGKPIAILIDFAPLWYQKNEIFGWAWQHFGVQSHAAYGDYDESCLFGFAAGLVMETLYRWIDKTETKKTVVAHANEWQTAFAIFLLRKRCPKIGTLFTTHATGIGRSIAGNGKPLYDNFMGYHGDQMAEELNMVSKHSVEKMAAKWADCFTTVSDITARECEQLLDKRPDVVTPNGFEPDFVPSPSSFNKSRTRARKALAAFAQSQGVTLGTNPFFVCTAGRQEWKNKGIDVFLDSMKQLGETLTAKRSVVAFVMVPYLDQPKIQMGRVTILFVPYYLDGHDPVFGLSYYDLLIGMDMSVFPSYYEPWGYTPLESIAFHVPTITTSLSGFGAWAEKECRVHDARCAMQGVTVVERTDSNYAMVIDAIVTTLSKAVKATKVEMEKAREQAADLSKKAEWKEFFRYYLTAYDLALKARHRR